MLASDKANEAGSHASPRPPGGAHRVSGLTTARTGRPPVIFLNQPPPASIELSDCACAVPRSVRSGGGRGGVASWVHACLQKQCCPPALKPQSTHNTQHTNQDPPASKMSQCFLSLSVYSHVPSTLNHSSGPSVSDRKFETACPWRTTSSSLRSGVACVLVCVTCVVDKRAADAGAPAAAALPAAGSCLATMASVLWVCESGRRG